MFFKKKQKPPVEKLVEISAAEARELLTQEMIRLMRGPPPPPEPPFDPKPPTDKIERVVYRVIDRKTGHAEGVYSRSYHDDYDFGSLRAARDSNVHNVYHDEKKFAVAKYKVTYELIDPDAKPIVKKEPT